MTVQVREHDLFSIKYERVEKRSEKFRGKRNKECEERGTTPRSTTVTVYNISFFTFDDVSVRFR